MKIELSSKDFEADVAKAANSARAAGRATILGPEDEEKQKRVWDALPSVLARRFQQIVPEGFEIHEIELNVEISGMPFGVGIGGTAKILFGPPRRS